MTERDTCPNCGAKPLEDRYPAHVKACRGEPPALGWWWSQGWRAKLNIIFVYFAVIVVALVRRAVDMVKEVNEDWEER